MSVVLLAATSGPVAAFPVEWPAQIVAVNVASSAMTIGSAGYAHVIYTTQPPYKSYYGTNKSGTWSFTPFPEFGGTIAPSIRADASGFVHVAFGCVYLTNRFGPWRQEDRGCGAFNVSEQVDLVVDDAGEVHVVAWTTDQHVLYSTNRRGFWITQDLGVRTAPPSIGLDSNHRVHIVSGATYLTNTSGAWVATTIPFGATNVYSRITVRGTTVRVLAGTSSGLKTAALSSGVWATAGLGAGTHVTGFLVDGNGRYHGIVYDSSTSAYDYLTNATGSWVRTPSIGYQVRQLGVSPSGVPAVTATGAEAGDLRFATKAVAPWTRAKVTGAIFAETFRDLQPSIAAGPTGAVKVAYTWPVDSGPSNTVGPGLFINTWSGSAWSPTRITTALDRDAHLALDGAGRIHVVTLRPGAVGMDQLMYGTNVTGSWVWTKLDEGRINCPRIALGPSTHAFVLYGRAGATYPVMRIATNRTGSWTPSTALAYQSQPSVTEACGAIDIDANDRVHAIYWGDGRIRYVSDTATQGTYAVQTSWDGGRDLALVLDTNGKVHALHQYGTTQYGTTTQVRYRTNVTGSWASTTLSYAYLAGSGMAIDRTPDGYVAAYGATLLVSQKSAGPWRATALVGVPAIHVGIAVTPGGSIFALYSETAFFGPNTGVYTFKR